MKVYVICIGEYSDRYIHGIMTDKEKAELWVEKYNKYNNDREAEIEVYELDKDAEDNRFAFNVYVDVDGKTTVNITDRVDEEDINDVIFVDYHDENRCQWWHTDIISYYFVQVKAIDPEHAEKIAHDLIAEYKAKEASIV